MTDWNAGSVGILTGGVVGDGFIEQNGVDANDETVGPNIVIYERTGVDADDLVARTILGNLNGYFGYAARTWGLAAGDPSDSNITIDPTNGVRIRHGSDTLAQYSDVVLLGSASGNNVYITSTSLALRNGTTAKIDMDVSGDMGLTGTLTMHGGGVIIGEMVDLREAYWLMPEKLKFLSYTDTTSSVEFVSPLHSQAQIGVLVASVIDAASDTTSGKLTMKSPTATVGDAATLRIGALDYNEEFYSELITTVTNASAANGSMTEWVAIQKDKNISIPTPFRFAHELATGQAVSDGIGAEILLAASTSETTWHDLASILSVWDTATPASRKGSLALRVADATTWREGLKIGTTGSAATIGVLGATPVARYAATADIKDALVGYGWLTDGGATPLNLDGGIATVGDATDATHALNRQTADARYAPIAAADHGNLTGLSDDDHTQYLLATGTRTGGSSQAQTFTNGIIGPSWKPASDSTTALKITNASATSLLTIDTTNKRWKWNGISGSPANADFGLLGTQTGQNVVNVQVPASHTQEAIALLDSSGNKRFGYSVYDNRLLSNGQAIFGGRVSGLPGNDRLQGASQRYTVTFANSTTTDADGLFDGTHSAAPWRMNAATSGSVEVNYSPFIAWTADTNTGYTYPAGQMLITFWSGYEASDITVESYRPSGGVDGWLTHATVSSNTSTSLLVTLPANHNYSKKIKITCSHASHVVWVSGISLYPTVAEATYEMAGLPRYAPEAVTLANKGLYLADTTWTTRTKFDYKVANGATAIAYLFDTANALSTAGAKLASWKNAGTEHTYIDCGGGLVVNDTGADSDSRFEGDTEPNLWFLDASADTLYTGGTSLRQAIDKNGDVWWEGDSSGPPYGSCWGNEIAWTRASAVQNTWYAISDTDMTDGQLNLVAHDGSGRLTVTKAGRYLVNYSWAGDCSGVGKHVQVGILVGGAAQNDGIQHFYVATASEEFNAAGTAILDLAASAYVEIGIRTTDTGTPNFTTDHLNITMLMVGGT